MQSVDNHDSPAAAPRTLADECQEYIAHLEKRYEDHDWIGDDWCELSEEEMALFEIDPCRLAPMVVAWDAYLAFLDLCSPLGFEAGLVETARRAYPAILEKGVDLCGFMDFAKLMTGLTNREAHAFFAKVEWWQIRSGLWTYSDEAGTAKAIVEG